MWRLLVNLWWYQRALRPLLLALCLNSEALPDPEPPVVSLLSRKRKILKNPSKGKKRSSGSCVYLHHQPLE